MELKFNEELKNIEGRKFKIIDRKKDPRGSAFDLIKCQFLEEPFDDNGNKVEVVRMASQVCRGLIYNPYVRSVFGVGYSGYYEKDENYEASIRDKWYSMLERCKSDEHYKNITIDSSWYNFSNFYDWVTSQIGYKDYSLDKDFSQYYTKNKVYGPSTCIMIPQSLNVCIVDKEDSSKLPTGVAKVKSEKKVEVTIPIMDENGCTRSIRLGRFLNTPNGLAEAFIHSKIARELKLKTIAQILYDNNYIDNRAYYFVSNYKYISRYTDMDRVNIILRPNSYKEDVERFILTHNEFNTILDDMVEKIKSIPLNILTPLHKENKDVIV